MGNPTQQAQKKKAALIKQGYTAKPKATGRAGAGGTGGTTYTKQISAANSGLDAVEKALGGTVTETITKNIGVVGGGGGRSAGNPNRYVSE